MWALLTLEHLFLSFRLKETCCSLKDVYIKAMKGFETLYLLQEHSGNLFRRHRSGGASNEQYLLVLEQVDSCWRNRVITVKSLMCSTCLQMLGLVEWICVFSCISQLNHKMHSIFWLCVVKTDCLKCAKFS